VTAAALIVLTAAELRAQDAIGETPPPPAASDAAPADAPATSNAPASAATKAPEAELPAVTIETGEEADKAKSQKAPTAPVVTVEDDNPPPPRKARKVKPKARVAPVVAAPAPPPEGFQAPADPTAGTGTTGVLGGPSGIEGYIAKSTTTATKTSTPIKDIPQSITVVTRKQADDQGARDLNQALTYVPGVNVALGEGHRDAVTIRGQQTTADFFINGVRDDVEYYRDLYNVQAIEILKGPAAMIFGRGGGGGIINRTTKEADGERVRDVTATYGMYDTKRITTDVGDAISSAAAFRLNAMYEDADGFRDFFEMERFGINPTMGFRLSDQTKLLVSYEYFHDARVVDRGVPSRSDRPSEGRKETFFGNPRDSNAKFEGHYAFATLEHRFSEDMKVRNHAAFISGDKLYRNTFANTAVSDAGLVDLSGYQDGTQRDSFVNQTDFIYRLTVAPGIRHTFLAGTEFTFQDTDVQRFNARFLTPDGAASITVPFANPTLFSPVFYNNPNRDRHTDLSAQSAYVQDQLEIGRYIELIGGLRFDRFDLDFLNGLNGDRFARVDNVWSPRAGMVFKPSDAISLYVSHSRSFLPSAGDQFNVLDVTTSTLEPEEFENREIGFKVDLAPRLLFTGALFQLDRSKQPVVVNAQTVQTGRTTTEGGELGLTGYLTDQWEIAAGFGHQIAIVESTGLEVPWVPHNTFSLWNRYQFTPMWGAGLGVVHKTSFFAAADNKVEVPGYTRLDAALFFELDDNWHAQVNIENLLNEDYFTSAHNNNNIMPGAPTSVYVMVGAKF